MVAWFNGRGMREMTENQMGVAVRGGEGYERKLAMLAG